MALQAMWVHGCTALPERTQGPSPGTGPLIDVNGVNWTAIVGFPQGGGKSFRGRDNQSNWFHFCIPTPVILNDARAKLQKVFVLFNADSVVSVTDVHVWDGPRQIYASNMPSGVSGRHDGSAGFSDLQPNITSWDIPDQPEVLFGVVISVRVQFTDEGNITFTAAGADFDA